MLANPAKLQFRARSSSWVEERNTYLGGSDIAAIMGLDPYRTALGVYHEKKGLAAALEINEPMVHGQNLELYVARCYRAETGRQIHRSRLYRHRDFPHLAVNPGYEIRGERPLRLLECKTTGYFAGQIFGQPGEVVPEQIPCAVHVAARHHPSPGLRPCRVDRRPRLQIYTIERDEELITALIERAHKFWCDFVLAGCPPPLTGREPDCHWVKDQHPASTEEVIYASPEMDELCKALREVSEGVKALSEEQARLENECKAYMRDAALMKTGIGEITWRSCKNGTRPFRKHFRG